MWARAFAPANLIDNRAADFGVVVEGLRVDHRHRDTRVRDDIFVLAPVDLGVQQDVVVVRVDPHHVRHRQAVRKHRRKSGEVLPSRERFHHSVNHRTPPRLRCCVRSVRDAPSDSTPFFTSHRGVGTDVSILTKLGATPAPRKCSYSVHLRLEVLRWRSIS